MTVNDLDLVTQPTAHFEFAIQPSVANSRLTFQHFNAHDVGVVYCWMLGDQTATSGHRLLILMLAL